MLTIIVRNPRLEYLSPRKGRLCRIRHNIDHCDAIQPSELFEVSISVLVPIHVFYRQPIVSSIGIGFEDVTPVRVRPLGHSHVQEDRIGA